MHYLAIFLPNSVVTGMPYLPAKKRWTCFLQPPFFPRALKIEKYKGFRPATIWRGAAFHFFGGFVEKENPLETLIVIFENVSPEGFSWLKMKHFEISVLTANSRCLRTAAFKYFIYFIPGLLIKQLLSMYMEDARFKDKGKRIRNTGLIKHASEHKCSP